MFIGRDRELATLEQLYDSNRFESVVLYGRRRVGKTTLLTHFVRDKHAIYCSGIEANEAQNLQRFTASVMEFATGMEGLSLSFDAFERALESVFMLAQDERIILVIDEYPYVAGASKSLGSVLQHLIHKHKDTSKLMLVLCGSSVSYMEDHVLAYKVPLYGRRTAQIKLEPFGFGDVCRLLPELYGRRQSAHVWRFWRHPCISASD